MDAEAGLVPSGTRHYKRREAKVAYCTDFSVYPFSSRTPRHINRSHHHHVHCILILCHHRSPTTYHSPMCHKIHERERRIHPDVHLPRRTSMLSLRLAGQPLLIMPVLQPSNLRVPSTIPALKVPRFRILVVVSPAA